MNLIELITKRLIIHCDMDNYFASVEMIDKPQYKYLPFAVCGDPALRHGIVLSKNDKAKAFGVTTGESIMEAKRKCPNLRIIVADYPKYLKYTKLFRAIYEEYTSKSNIYPYGMDEAWLDVTDVCANIQEAITLIEVIKNRINNELNLTISVGVSFNYVFSKIGSDMKLKKGAFVIDKDNYLNITENMPAFSLLFVGAKTRNALKKMDILTIGDLRKADINVLKQKFGKKGIMLYNFAWGDDREFNPNTINSEEIKSIGNTITTPKDLSDKCDIEAYIYVLSSIISKRLHKHNLIGKTVFLGLKFNDFTTYSKQVSLSNYFSDLSSIYDLSLMILNKGLINKPIRSITMRINNVKIKDLEQLSLFIENNEGRLHEVVSMIKEKYGDILIEKSSTSKNMED